MSGQKVLFISYNFPPHGGAGVQRSLKFVKYLPQFGWRPLVIAADPDAGPVRDDSLLADIPAGTRIDRIEAFSIYRFIARLRRLGLGKLAVLVNLLLQIPDPARFWAAKAFPVAMQVVHQEHPDAIYSTSGPYSDHLLAMRIARQTGLPWLADFRDPWSSNLLIPYLPGYRKVNRRMERQVLQAANQVVSISPPWLDDFQSHLDRDKEKFSVISNGYDPADIPVVPGDNGSGPFILTHLGSFYRNRRPDDLIKAVRLLIDRGDIPAEDIRIRFIGKNPPGSVPLEAPFEHIPYIPHKELQAYRQSTSALLLLLNTSPQASGDVSGKIFEYIASNRPILGIVPPGGTAEQLIEQTRTGISVTSNPQEIASALLSLYTQRKSGLPFQPDWEAVRQYERPRLTGQLAGLLDHLAGLGRHS